ncbi:MAG: hypothetical protein IJO73_07475 [Clostridia bacterium]|nr:hypothetical protein [Clostridia bacterium]
MKNAGYTILQKEIYNFTDNFGVALGHNGKMFVTWEFTREGKNYSFYWGHYFADHHKAFKDYHDRLSQNYDQFIEEEIHNEIK